MIMQPYEPATQIDEFSPKCNMLPARSKPMPDDVSALQLLVAGDPALLAIVRLSLIVSLSAVVFGGLIGVPFGAAVALRAIRSLLASARARATIRIAFRPVSLSKNATPVAL